MLFVGGVGAGRDERDGVVSIRSIRSILDEETAAGDIATGAGCGVDI